MSKYLIDYDTIAPRYDRRFDNSRPNPMLKSLVLLRQAISARRILEVGCGTAHWLAGLQEQAGDDDQIELYGLDLSGGMLKRAQEKGQRLQLAQAQAGELPYQTASFDLIYCVNAIHHFPDPRRFIHEARRLLRPGAVLAIMGMDPRGHSKDWYIYHYFTGAYQRDLERFPSWGNLLDWMVEAGFKDFCLEFSHHIHDPKLGAAVLKDPYLEKNAASQLALLSDEAYQAGVERIRRAVAAAEVRGEQIIFPCELDIHIMNATTPG